MATLPFHSGLARSYSDAGRSASLILAGSKASTFSRTSTPTQLPSAGLNLPGTACSVAASAGASSFFSSSSTSSGEFSVKYRSAGERAPSRTIWAASSGASPNRVLTTMPVCLVKAAITMSTSWWCCAAYSVSVVVGAAAWLAVAPRSNPAAADSQRARRRDFVTFRWVKAWSRRTRLHANASHFQRLVTPMVPRVNHSSRAGSSAPAARTGPAGCVTARGRPWPRGSGGRRGWSQRTPR